MANSTDGVTWMTRIIVASVLAAGCSSLGPGVLQENRLKYNEAVKTTSEEELLLNIVRLRYTDTPSSLAVSAIVIEDGQHLRIGRHDGGAFRCEWLCTLGGPYRLCKPTERNIKIGPERAYKPGTVTLEG